MTPNGIIEDITVNYVSAFFLRTVCVPALTLLVSAGLTVHVRPAEAKNNSSGYAGSIACKTCHEKEYNSFLQYSKKAKSFESIEKMRKGLTEEEIKKCYF
ncbi:MAG: cytochrome c family protein, partial [Nitrospirota bacterium]|nr:cytochrome c family protein [Nitrospirota bacterium]